MKFTILSLALLSFVAADVSHLNNKYLPPVLDSLAGKQHVSYVQETQQIPQASVQEVNDNSVYEEISAQEKAQIASGQLVVGNGIPNIGAVDQHIPNVDNVAYQVQAYGQQAVVTASEETTVSDSKLHHSTPQQQHEPAAYNTQVSQQQQQKEVVSQVEPLQSYHVKEYVKPEQTTYSAGHVEHHHAEHQNQLNQQQQQQQQAVYNSQQSISADTTVSAGIDTQYAANGGYVY